MILPPFLKAGDKVAMVSPGKVILKKEITQAIAYFNSWGLEVVIGPNALKKWNRFAGSDAERKNDFQWALDDPSIKAVICNRGGYGSIRIIESLDFDNFKKSPKWIVGYSDVTIFHGHLNHHLRIASIHGTMPLNMKSEDNRKTSIEGLRRTLFGEEYGNEWEAHSFNINGKAKGQIIGGNLSILASLIGTSKDFLSGGKILFMEDLCEELYHLDRMLYQLKFSNKFEGLSGVIIGSFSDMTDVSGWFSANTTAYQIINAHLSELGVPVSFGFPAGHEAQNHPLVLGKEYELNVSELGCTLK
ncbi:MAG: LD-carboxypeptidase [Flavobacteriales bacterium]|nr:LD-carboxypeptidase [Flavobacteriales bacterium]